VVLEPTARRISIDGAVLPLTTVEYEILSRLVESAGTIIARERLSLEVFDRRFNPDDRSLDVHVYRLRKKLGPHGWLLVTVRGCGHLLRAPAARPGPADPLHTRPDAAAAPADRTP
jgi:two-component system response regulator CpxR